MLILNVYQLNMIIVQTIQINKKNYLLSIKKEKLLNTLENKEKYVVHIETLKQALLHGFELKKVLRVISFNQEAQLKPHIDKNTELRKNAKNDFEKDFFKLMINESFLKNCGKCKKLQSCKTSR